MIKSRTCIEGEDIKKQFNKPKIQRKRWNEMIKQGDNPKLETGMSCCPTAGELQSLSANWSDLKKKKKSSVCVKLSNGGTWEWWGSAGWFLMLTPCCVFSSSVIYLLFVFVLFIYFIISNNNKINNKKNNFFKQVCERHTRRTVLRTSQYLLSPICLLSFYGWGASEESETNFPGWTIKFILILILRKSLRQLLNLFTL